MAHISLRDRQIAAVKKVLSLNESRLPETEDQQDGSGAETATSGLSTEAPIWKVLVFDDFGRDVISTILRVEDLRKQGITIFLNINATRHMIPDVPVIYLCEPNATNAHAITQDLSNGLYSPAYVNFLSSIPRPVLEDFAGQIATAGVAEHISQVYDQHLNFLTLEPDLFSLGMGQETYWAMNSAQVSDEVMDLTVDRIVSGLFSVVATMGVVPIIRCPRKGAAEAIAGKLDRKLRDHVVASKDNLFSTQQQKNSSSNHPTSRPVLVILDRQIDLVPMLTHSWTYSSLVNDALKMHLNRITVEVPTEDSNTTKTTSKRSYDVNSKDFFWAANANRAFPNVAEDIDAQLIKYKDDAAEITKKTGASSIEDLDMQNDTNNSAQHLKAAITLLPELRERKSILDMHMSILSALLAAIKDRRLDHYYQLEETITKQTKAQMLEFLKEGDKGSQLTDALRLFIIWYLSIEQEVSNAEMEGYEQALKSTGIDTSPLQYVRHVRQITRMTMMATTPSQQTQQSASNEIFRGFSSISSRLTDRFKDAGIGANFDNLISSARALIPVNRDLTVTQLTESLMDPQNAPSSAIAKTENYLYFDPRSANARGTMPPASQVRNQGMPGGLNGAAGRGIEASFGQKRAGFNEAIVFMVGGGSLDEFSNLQQFVTKRNSGSGGNPGSRRRIVYGSTELMNAQDFLMKELARLGHESS